MLDHNQLLHFRERQLQSLMDTCHRLVHSYTTNEYNEKVDVYTEDTTDIPCGVEQSGNERRRTTDTVTTYDATIRLVISEAWDVKDRIKIIKRYGEALSIPIVYEIASPIQRGPSGIRLLARKIDL